MKKFRKGLKFSAYNNVMKFTLMQVTFSLHVCIFFKKKKDVKGESKKMTKTLLFSANI